MKAGVVVFPGSNCDHDLYHVLKHVLQNEVEFIWHKEMQLPELDAVFLPGGFSYGDYLRTGAIARFSPIMREIIAFAQRGGVVMGICNGFQVLCEAGLLPGTLRRNRELDFICKPVHVKVETTASRFANVCEKGEVLQMPIAHGEGNYYAAVDDLKAIEDNNQIVLRYCSPKGEIEPAFNPNGSVSNIAGLQNESGNVFGMMPHPERAGEDILGSASGLKIFKSIAESLIAVA